MSDDITVEECLDLLCELVFRVAAARERMKAADEESMAAHKVLQATYDELRNAQDALRAAALKEAGFK